MATRDGQTNHNNVGHLTRTHAGRPTPRSGCSYSSASVSEQYKWRVLTTCNTVSSARPVVEASQPLCCLQPPPTPSSSIVLPSGAFPLTPSFPRLLVVYVFTFVFLRLSYTPVTYDRDRTKIIAFPSPPWAQHSYNLYRFEGLKYTLLQYCWGYMKATRVQYETAVGMCGSLLPLSRHNNKCIYIWILHIAVFHPAIANILFLKLGPTHTQQNKNIYTKYLSKKHQPVTYQ